MLIVDLKNDYPCVFKIKDAEIREYFVEMLMCRHINFQRIYNDLEDGKFALITANMLGEFYHKLNNLNSCDLFLYLDRGIMDVYRYTLHPNINDYSQSLLIKDDFTYHVPSDKTYAGASPSVDDVIDYYINTLNFFVSVTDFSSIRFNNILDVVWAYRKTIVENEETKYLSHELKANVFEDYIYLDMTMKEVNDAYDQYRDIAKSRGMPYLLNISQFYVSHYPFYNKLKLGNDLQWN